MRRIKNIAPLLAAILVSAHAIGQPSPVPFAQLDSLQKVEKRNVLVFIHTTWCRYCAAMVQTTFANKEVREKIAGKFYFVSLDAEDRATISFRGYNFRYKPTGAGVGVHELAESLGAVGVPPSYPTIFFFNADLEIVYRVEGFVTAGALLHVLRKFESHTLFIP